MTQDLRSLRRQRERGRRRVAVITASGAVGATALATAFGMVFAEQRTAAAATFAPPALTSADAADPAQPLQAAPARVAAVSASAAPAAVAEPSKLETTRAEAHHASGTSTTNAGLAAPAESPKDVAFSDQDSSSSDSSSSDSSSSDSSDSSKSNGSGSGDSDRHAKHSKSHASSGGS